MSHHRENSLQTAVRWAGNAIFIASLFVLFYHALVAVMHLFVPVDKKAKQRVAKRLGCDASVLPEAFACYAILYGVLALLWLVIAVSAYAILFAQEDGMVPGFVGG